MESNKTRKNRLLRVDQVAQRLCCSKRHIYHLIESNELPALRIGKKKGYRIREDAVEAFISKKMDDFFS